VRIAFLSFQFPKFANYGGIGTYVKQVAEGMAALGDDVEVFCGSDSDTGFSDEGGYRVNFVRSDREGFSSAIPPVFAERHLAKPFDIIEVADYNAEGIHLIPAYPDLPVVMRLHTPEYLVKRVEDSILPLMRRIRAHFGAIKRGKRSTLIYNRAQDPEYAHARMADRYMAPCRDILPIVGKDWKLDPSRSAVVPNPFTPSPILLDIPIETDSHTITFIGRVEVIKGVLDLGAAIPLVLQKHPDWKFRFVGAYGGSPRRKTDMATYIKDMVGERFAGNLEFAGARPHSEVPAELKAAAICAFPSLWDNFPGVCLEAMAAGRPVVATHAGGMPEILAEGKAGLLVPPHDPEQLAAAICSLIESKDKRLQISRAARERITSAYPASVVAPQIRKEYERTIEYRKKDGTRKI
jgi:glycogen synthase